MMMLDKVINFDKNCIHGEKEIERERVKQIEWEFLQMFSVVLHDLQFNLSRLIR